MNEHTRLLHDLGQTLWLDGVNRKLLSNGSLQRYIRDFCISGLTSNTASFERALRGGAYDASLRGPEGICQAGDELFFELVLDDMTQAADEFRPIYEASGGVDGWVSLDLSPLLADNTARLIQSASRLHERAARPNLLIKIPGTPEGVRAVEEVIFDGVPVHITMLYSPQHYLAAAQAYMRGIERRRAANLSPRVASVASIVISRWDVAVEDQMPGSIRNRLGVAMAMRSYRVHREVQTSARCKQLVAAGACPMRLIWAGMGTPDWQTPDDLYVQALVAPDTIVTLPEWTLLSYADHGRVETSIPMDGGYADAVIEEFRREGIDDLALAQELQRQAIDELSVSWHAMVSKLREMSTAGRAARSI